MIARGPMKSDDRQKMILDLLADREYCSTNELIELVPSSPATIRRDLVVMEQGGLIRKARGRIFLQTPSRVPSFDLRGLLHDKEKDAIGRAAAALVNEGDSIIIDSGTTALALANHLRHFKRLSVVTNSIPVAYTFNGTGVKTFVCGGMVSDMALIDDDAIAYFASRKVNKVFLGATGVRGEEGLTISTSFQYQVKRRMMASGEEVYAIIDSSKFDSLGITVVADFRELTGLVTSRPIKNERLLARLGELGVKVVYARDEDFSDAGEE